MTVLCRLWRGEVPLAQAFWNWAVIGALIVNGATTLAFLMLIMTSQPIMALTAGYAISVPYNIVVAVGVWRAAARYPGDPQWATLARVVSLAMLAVLSIT